MRILVLGGTGMVGSQFMRSYIDEGTMSGASQGIHHPAECTLCRIIT